MSDFGGEVSNSAMGMGAKVIQAILTLLEKIFYAWQHKEERQLKKLQLKNAKSEEERKAILEKLDGRVGYYRYSKLKKAGVPLTPLEVKMTREQMKEFGAEFKRNRCLYTAVMNTKLSEDGKIVYDVLVKTEDLIKVRDLIDKLNDEKFLKGVEQQIENIMSKGEENLTEQDKVDLKELNSQKELLQRKYCEKMNAEQSNQIIDKAANGIEMESVNLDEALNKWTGRAIDKDIYCIVADAKDPDKYIRCHGYNENYKGKDYIKTEYEVFRGSQMVYKAHDGRFDNRPSDYWDTVKANIREKGGFGDSLFKFYNIEEYNLWAKEVRLQNKSELGLLEANAVYRDYEEIIKSLNTQLEEQGAYFKNGVVLDKETNKPIIVSSEMTMDEKAKCSEMIVIGKQIVNYQNISQIEVQKTLVETNLLTMQDDSHEKEAEVSKLEKLKEKYDRELELKDNLINERKDINAIQADQISRDKTLEKDVSDKDMGSLKMDSIQKEIKARKSKVQSKPKDAEKQILDNVSKKGFER